jgi:hypothetical protein
VCLPSVSPRGSNGTRFDIVADNESFKLPLKAAGRFDDSGIVDIPVQRFVVERGGGGDGTARGLPSLFITRI